MKKILLGLSLVFSLALFLGFSPSASAEGFNDVDWSIPMTSSTVQTKLRIGVANFAKVGVFKATMTNGEITELFPVCTYASSSTGVNPIIKECNTFVNNDNQNLIIASFSNNPNAGMMADVLTPDGGVHTVSNPVNFPRIVSASIVPANTTTFSTVQLIPEVNYGFTSQNTIIAQNGDSGWNELSFSPEAAWIGAGLPIPDESGHYIITLIKNSGAPASTSGPNVDFKANNSTLSTVTLATSTTPVTLTWSAPGASYCNALPTTATPTYAGVANVWSGNNKPSNGTFPITAILNANTDYTFKIICFDASGYGASKTVVVKIPQHSAPAVTLTPVTSNVPFGTVVTLTWDSTNATSCNRTDGSTGWQAANMNPDGTFPVGTTTPIGTHTYKITCTGLGGTTPIVTATVTVLPPVASVAFNPATLPTTTVQLVNNTVTANLNWIPTNANNCSITSTGTPVGPTGTIDTTTGTSWSGTFNAVGSYSYIVTCQGTGGATGATTATGTVQVNPVTTNPLPPVITNFSATPNPVPIGTTTTLTWASIGATSCTAVAANTPWTTSGSTGNTWTSPTLNTAGTIIYGISCMGLGGTTNATVDVVVKAPTVTLTPGTTSLQVGVDTVVLHWDSTDATSCSRDGGYGAWQATNVSADGDFTVTNTTPIGNYFYSITCVGPGGQTIPVVALVSVQAAASASVNFSNPSILVQVQKPVTLSWTPNANVVAGSCVVNNVTAPANATLPTGNITGNSWTTASTGFTTIGDYVYKVTCNAIVTASPPHPESTMTVRVMTTLPTPSLAFSASAINVQIGGYSTLHWDSSSVDSCNKATSSDPHGLTFPGDWLNTPWNTSGSAGWSAGPFNALGKYKYTITCVPFPGTGILNVTKSVEVTVDPATTPQAPVVTITASDNPILVGQTTVLAWDSTTGGPVTSCAKTGPSTWMGVSGNNGTWTTGKLNAPGTATYTIKCTGLGGEDTASVIVRWNSKVTDTTVDISALSKTIPAGGTATINWISGNSNYCARTGGSAGWSAPSVPGNVSGTWTSAPLAVGTYTYTIKCYNITSGATATSAVTVKALAPTVALTANGTANNITINGTKVNLAWTSQYTAPKCTVSTTVTSKGVTGSPSNIWTGTKPSTSAPATIGGLLTGSTYSFNISCDGINSGTASSTVSVKVAQAPAVDLKVDIGGHGALVNGPVNISSAGSIRLAWTSTNVTTCSATTKKGIKNSTTPWSGTKAKNSTSPSISGLQSGNEYTFTLTCTGLDGSASDSVKVNVTS